MTSNTAFSWYSMHSGSILTPTRIQKRIDYESEYGITRAKKIHLLCHKERTTYRNSFISSIWERKGRIVSLFLTKYAFGKELVMFDQGMTYCKVGR